MPYEANRPYCMRTKDMDHFSTMVLLPSLNAYSARC